MISFKTYMVEQSEIVPSLEKAKKIATYIKSDRYRQMYIESLDELIKAVQADEVYKARFNEYKSRISRGIEYGYKTMHESIIDELKDREIDTFDLWSITTINEIKKVAKIYDKLNPKIQKASEFMDNIRAMPDVVKMLKPMLKSGRPKKEPKPGQFIKPLASNAAMKMAVKFMEEATKTFKKELHDNVKDSLTTAYDKIKDITDPKELPKDSASKAVASTVFIIKGYGRNKSIELKSNSSEIVKKMIEDTVKDIVESFIAKNASKLALIFEKKNEPSSHKIIRTNINNGKVENTMDFVFSDGSSFTLQSSVVYKYSSTGKFFMQYPTRFKNVKLADGSKMRGPSEEKMIKEF